MRDMRVYPSCIIVNFMFKFIMFMGISHIVAFTARIFFLMYRYSNTNTKESPKAFPANILSRGLLINSVRKFSREFYFRD